MAAVFDTSFVSGDAIFDTSFAESPSSITLREDYERSSVNLSGSSVSGTGDDAVITIKPRVQWSEVASGTTKTRWLEPSVRIDGVDGIRPSFKFIDYAPTATAGTMVGAPYPSTRRPMFSYDRLTWHYFDTTTVTSTEIQFRHDTAFTGDTIYVGRSRQRSVAQVGDWLETIAAAHPTKIAPTPAAAAFTPTLTSWPAQSFIAGEFSTQTDELGRTIPQTPFWAFEINDTALGGSKRLAVMYCGVHAGEDHASHAFERAVEYLLGSSASAIALRTHYRIVIYPMLNAPGRAGGGWRGSFTLGTGGADDPNRHFGDIDGLEIVSVPRAALATDIASVVPDWMLDWHGTYINNYSLFINRANQTEFQSRAAAASGFTVGNEGTLTSDCVEQYFHATLGTPFVATLEHGDKNPQTDANLITWAEAVIDTMESMRADEYFYSLTGASGELHATISDVIATLEGTAGGAGVSGELHATLSDVTASIAGAITASGELHAATSDVIATLAGYVTITGELHATVSDIIAMISGVSLGPAGVDLEIVKRWCRIDGSEFDVILPMMVSSAVALAEQETGRDYSAEEMPPAVLQFVCAHVSYWINTPDAALEKSMMPSPFVARLLDPYRLWEMT